MTRNFQLLDGSATDLDKTPLPATTRTSAQAEGATVLETDFAQGENPWWLSAELDASASQSFSGLAGGGTATTTLSTGASADATAALVGPDINYGDWSEIRLWVSGLVPSSIAGKGAWMSLSDAPSTGPTDAVFHCLYFSDPEMELAAYDAGTRSDVRLKGEVADQLTPASVGMHCYEHDHPASDGHTLDAHFRGEHYDSFSSGMQLPPPQPLTFSVGLRTTDRTDRTLTLEHIRIELVP